MREDIMTPRGRRELEDVKVKIKTLYFYVHQYEWNHSLKELKELLEDLS